MFTIDNTEGFSQSDLTRMNAIASGIAAAHPDLSQFDAIEEAMGQSFDPELSDNSNEHWALSRLQRA